MSLRRKAQRLWVIKGVGGLVALSASSYGVFLTVHAVSHVQHLMFSVERRVFNICRLVVIVLDNGMFISN